MINSINRRAKRSALLLVRTPLQAWIAEQVLRAEAVTSYDFIYFTHNDSSEDRHYFNRLSASADHAQYCYAPTRRFDIFGNLDFYWQTKKWHHDLGHEITLMASIDSHLINAISKQQVTSELITFDDGLANILPSDRYSKDNISWRSRIYRKFLGASDLAITKHRIAYHYTLYEKFDNIVESGRLKLLSGWNFNGQSRNIEKDVGALQPIKTYFIGQPFEEAMSAEHVNILENYVKTLGIDIYVRHPREVQPLDIRVPFLEKADDIAENAILRDAKNCEIHIFGWFSTVLFNLNLMAIQRTMILMQADPVSSNMAEMARKVGCEVILL